MLLEMRRGDALNDVLIILVVEDEVLIQSLLTEALQDGGYEAKIASSGEEAIKLLDAAEPHQRHLDWSDRRCLRIRPRGLPAAIDKIWVRIEMKKQPYRNEARRRAAAPKIVNL